MIQFWTRDKTEYLYIPEDKPQFFVAHLGQRRVHHQDQADGNGDIGGSDLKYIDEIPYAGIQIAPEHPDSHGQKDPQREKTVQKAQFFNGRISHASS